MSGTGEPTCTERWTAGVCTLFRLSDGRYFLDETYLARRHVLTPPQGAQIADLMRLDLAYRPERFDDVVAAYAAAACVTPEQILAPIDTPYLVHLNTDGKAMVITALPPPGWHAPTQTAASAAPPAPPPPSPARQFGEEIASMCRIIDAYTAKNLPPPRSSTRRLREIAEAIAADGGAATTTDALNEANRIYRRSGVVFARHHADAATQAIMR
jgi:hypothetical protein